MTAHERAHIIVTYVKTLSVAKTARLTKRNRMTVTLLLRSLGVALSRGRRRAA